MKGQEVVGRWQTQGLSYKQTIINAPPTCIPSTRQTNVQSAVTSHPDLIILYSCRATTPPDRYIGSVVTVVKLRDAGTKLKFRDYVLTLGLMVFFPIFTHLEDVPKHNRSIRKN